MGITAFMLLIFYAYVSHVNSERVEERIDTINELDNSAKDQQLKDIDNARNIKNTIDSLNLNDTNGMFDSLPEVKTNSYPTVPSRLESHTNDQTGQTTSEEAGQYTVQKRTNKQPETVGRIQETMCPPVWDETLKEYIPVPCSVINEP